MCVEREAAGGFDLGLGRGGGRGCEEWCIEVSLVSRNGAFCLESMLHYGESLGEVEVSETLGGAGTAREVEASAAVAVAAVAVSREWYRCVSAEAECGSAAHHSPRSIVTQRGRPDFVRAFRTVIVHQRDRRILKPTDPHERHRIGTGL